MRSQDENSTQGERKKERKKERQKKTGSTKLVCGPKLILGEVIVPSFGFSLPVHSLLAHVFFIKWSIVQIRCCKSFELIPIFMNQYPISLTLLATLKSVWNNLLPVLWVFSSLCSTSLYVNLAILWSYNSSNT